MKQQVHQSNKTAGGFEGEEHGWTGKITKVGVAEAGPRLPVVECRVFATVFFLRVRTTGA